MAYKYIDVNSPIDILGIHFSHTPGDHRGCDITIKVKKGKLTIHATGRDYNRTVLLDKTVDIPESSDRL